MEAVETETKSKILDAAEELFALEGYRGASLKAIAAKAGVTGAMINYYFSKKANLYHAVLDRLVADIEKMVKDVLATGLPPRQRLEIFYGWFFDYAAQHPNFARLTKMGLGGPEKEHFERIVSTFFRPMFQVGVGFFDGELPRGHGKSPDTDHLLLAIYGMTISYFTDSEFMSLILGRNALGKKELEKRKECMLEMIFRTLGLERPGLSGDAPNKSR